MHGFYAGDGPIPGIVGDECVQTGIHHNLSRIVSDSWPDYNFRFAGRDWSRLRFRLVPLEFLHALHKGRGRDGPAKPGAFHAAFGTWIFAPLIGFVSVSHRS